MIRTRTSRLSFLPTFLCRSLLLVAFVCPGADATGGTLVVPVDFPTIQQAIDAACDGMVIEVRPGTYVENLDFLGKEITVRSTDGPGQTIIDGSQPLDPTRASVVRFTSGETVFSVLEGFRLTGGSGTLDASSARVGGGVAVIGSGATLRDNEIQGNSADSGGGLYILSGTAVLESNRYSGNTATFAGGGIFSFLATATLAGEELENNSARDGGGAFLRGSSGSLRSCAFGANAATGSGGGLYYSHATDEIVDCTFDDNTADLGGAVYLLDEAYVVFRACRFSGNEATDGGAVYHAELIDSSHPHFESCLFDSNHAFSEGGAFYLDAYVNLTVALSNCTLAENVADGDGGAIYRIGDARLVVRHSILWRNTPLGTGPAPGLFTNIRFSNVEGGQEGQGNIEVNPLFLDPLNGDFRLHPGSVCIDRGPNSQIPPGNSGFDLDGLSRIVDGDLDGEATVDLGAYEFVASPLDGRLGNVNVGLETSQRADVLLVNGTAGDAERVVTVTTGEAIRLELAAPPSRPGPQTSRHVTYAWIGEPDPLDISRQALGPVLLGWTAFPTPLVGGSPQPVRLWNRFGHEPLLGTPDFPSGLAPTVLFFLPNGRQAPATVTFQGYIEDDNAAIPEGVSVTNGVTLRIVP